MRARARIVAAMRILSLALLSLAACVGQLPGSSSDDDLDAAGGGDGAATTDGSPPFDPVVHVPLDAERPVDLMPADRLALVASRMPRIADPWLKGVLESPDTCWYDKHSIVPGYQDSFGDNVETPIGFRPNTIDRGLIDLAVPGGHAQIFVETGLFHFPFGRPIGNRTDNLIVDFWHVPRDGGAFLPVVWWRRDPNGYTHRIEWMFPVGTVLGEILFEVEGGVWWPFEIRTRVRELDHWRVDVFRPFPTATDLADALARKRTESPAWQSAADLTALIAHVRDPSTLVAATLSGSHFRGAFAPQTGARDVLPGLADDTILQALLLETPFRSARGAVWKRSGALTAYAPTTAAGFSIVPRDYDGGFLEVDDQKCNRCHENAGRPFKDYYDNILAYGELWGMDDAFTWHPFVTSNFVDGAGQVVNFNHDNRVMRPELLQAGVLAPYDGARDVAPRYGKLPGAWKNWAY